MKSFSGVFCFRLVNKSAYAKSTNPLYPY